MTNLEAQIPDLPGFPAPELDVVNVVLVDPHFGQGIAISFAILTDVPDELWDEYTLTMSVRPPGAPIEMAQTITSGLRNLPYVDTLNEIVNSGDHIGELVQHGMAGFNCGIVLRDVTPVEVTVTLSFPCRQDHIGFDEETQGVSRKRQSGS